MYHARKTGSDRADNSSREHVVNWPFPNLLLAAPARDHFEGILELFDDQYTSAR